MALAVVLREDFDGAGLRRLARLSGDANQVRRLLALAVIYDGGARRAAAEVGGVGLQTVRDWVLRFNANGPEGLLDGKAPGPRPVLGAEHKQALAEIIEQGPIPASHGVVRWRIVDLMQWLFDEFGVSVSKQTGTVRNFVCGRAVEHYAAMARMKRSPKMTANCALAIDHSRGGIFHSFSDRFKIR